MSFPGKINDDVLHLMEDLSVMHETVGNINAHYAHILEWVAHLLLIIEQYDRDKYLRLLGKFCNQVNPTIALNLFDTIKRLREELEL